MLTVSALRARRGNTAGSAAVPVSLRKSRRRMVIGVSAPRKTLSVFRDLSRGSFRWWPDRSKLSPALRLLWIPPPPDRSRRHPRLFSRPPRQLPSRRLDFVTSHLPCRRLPPRHRRP